MTTAICAAGKESVMNELMRYMVKISVMLTTVLLLLFVGMTTLILLDPAMLLKTT